MNQNYSGAFCLKHFIDTEELEREVFDIRDKEEQIYLFIGKEIHIRDTEEQRNIYSGLNCCQL